MLTAGLASRRWRGRMVRIARELGYYHQARPLPTLPRVDAGRVAAENTPVIIREPLSSDGNVELLELLVLTRAVAQRAPCRLFEIGTFDGRTTLNLAANSPNEAKVFTLDLPAAPRSIPPGLDPDDLRFARASASGTLGRRFHGTVEAPKIVQLIGDSAAFDFTPYRGSADFVFVDGSHAYDYVVRDSLAALELAAADAIIFWHDYGTWPDVTRALNELAQTDPRFSALRHVDATTLVVLQL